jgi:hypothetical protein
MAGLSGIEIAELVEVQIRRASQERFDRRQLCGGTRHRGKLPRRACLRLPEP